MSQPLIKSTRNPSSLPPDSSSSSSSSFFASSQPEYLQDPTGPPCPICAANPRFVVHHPVIQSFHGPTDEASSEMKRIAAAILKTCVAVENLCAAPEVGNYVAQLRIQSQMKEVEEKFFMGFGREDQRKMVDLSKEWKTRHPPSVVVMGKMRVMGYQMVECYKCKGMLEVMIYGL